MRRTRLSVRHGVTVLVLTLAAGLLAGVPAASAAPAQKVPIPTITWTTCSDATLASRGVECADVKVPLDHAKPRGKTITVAISRVRHTVPADEYQGVMLVNPGGPGGSGLGLSLLGAKVPKGAGAAYDWIGFDPRGVGQSKPALTCDPQYAGYDRPPYVPSTRAIEKAWFAKTRAYTADCDDSNGAILDHLTTRDVAKDLDLIRAGLGQKQLNYYGFSYGTYLGQVYSTLFPQRVRRMVFDGTVDPRGVWYDANLEQDKAFDRNIDIWFRWVAQHDSTYHLGTTGRVVRRQYYATLDRLNRQPVQASGGRLGGSEWNDTLLRAGYYESTWTSLATVFSRFVNDDDVAAFEKAYLSASGYGNDNGYAVYLGVQCTDTSWPKSWRKWTRDNWAIHATAPFQTWANAWFNEPCRHWPGTSRRPVTIDGARTKSVLMLNETLDAATPYPGSIEVRRRYPGARLIATPGGTTHSNSLKGNACVDDQIADYLLAGTLPKRVKGDRADATCTALPKPEPVAVSAPSARSLRADDQGDLVDRLRERAASLG